MLCKEESLFFFIPFHTVAVGLEGIANGKVECQTITEFGDVVITALACVVRVVERDA